MTDIQTALATATTSLPYSDSASLDAEVLLCYVLKKPRSHLRTWPEKLLSAQQHKLFTEYLAQRQQGMPIAYITGNREFWSRHFTVNSNVLIPRPDTELLIELSLKLITNKSQAQVIDLGTGSGIIAITLAAERPNLTVIATDYSEKALTIAKQNAKNQQIKNIHFNHSFWFNEIPPDTFDLVISNPPYIADNDPHLSQGDLRFEPKMALIAENNGLNAIQMISDQARDYLKPTSTLLIEHGCDQAPIVQAIFKSFAYQQITTHNDLSGHPRVTTGQWIPTCK